MNDSATQSQFPGASEMARRMREFDWSATDLGPPSQWSAALKTATAICLNSRFPIVMYWGPDFTVLYNDAYIPFLGEKKHPKSLGRPAHEVWEELWPTIGPMLSGVLATGEATWSEDLLMFFARRLPLEEVYVTFTFGPVHSLEDASVEGIFCACKLTTEKIVAERRLKTLRDLGARMLESRSVETACERATEVMAANPHDIPFAAIYVCEGDELKLARCSGLTSSILPAVIALSGGGASAPWPLARVALTRSAEEVELAPIGDFPGGPWPEPAKTAVALPILAAVQESVAGVLIAGASPRRVFDSEYRDFFTLVAAHIAAAIADAQAYKQERERAEALAELDRAKTMFFANVSHEFRTPLTLMLGPLADALARSESEVAAEVKDELEVARRNALRLQKLVNTLLDFSRIEAGRVRASYEPTDLAAFTAELASVFRSAVEKAGLRLSVDCPPLAAPVYVDRDMYEKVVLNLISNAFKFTHEGEIEVTMTETPEAAEICVRDTGVGIPDEHLPHVFERFHRVAGVKARTHEGTGIGLALVQELVKLHGGEVNAESTHGRGSAFTARFPKGKSHLPSDRINETQSAATAQIAGTYVEEARRWSRQKSTTEEQGPGSEFDARESDLVLGPPPSVHDARPRVVWADDNADMRDYVCRLLGGCYRVEAAANGKAALAAVRRQLPDLVLTDVMMPELDGFGLLRELRADPRTRTLPVILLSARAGQESRVEGLEAGADDYIIKPFSARELLASIDNNLKLARVRSEAARSIATLNDDLRRRVEEMEILLRSLPVPVFMAHDPLCSNITMNAAAAELLRLPQNANASKTGPEADRLPFRVLKNGAEVAPEDLPLQRAARLGVPNSGEELDIVFADGGLFTLHEYAAPLFDDAGRARGSVGVFIDLTERKRTEEELRESQQRFRALADNMSQLAWMTDERGWVFWYNRRWFEYTATTLEEMQGWGWQKVHHPDHVERVVEKVSHCFASGEVWDDTFPLRGADGNYRWFLSRALPIRDSEGKVTRWFGTNTDITEQREAEAALRESGRRKDEFLATLAHELRNPLAPLRSSLDILRIAGRDPQSVERMREIMERQVNYMVRLVDDLLEVSRITRGSIELRKERVELAALIRGAAEIVKPLIDTAGHQLAISLPSEPVFLDADPVRLSQVFADLLNNAAKYTDIGGKIWVYAEVAGNEVVISVRDSGTGIEAAMLPKIFDMFTQAKSAHAPGGLGIGLTLVRSLLHMHGGRVEAISEGLGKGSEFIVRLPVAGRGDAPRRIELAPERLIPQRILVVDDNRDAADSLGMLLRLTGAEVHVVYGGNAALQALATYQPEIVLLDLGMPEMDGIEVARRIRKHSEFKDVAVIALTGWGQEEDRGRTRTAGFDYHLVKPVDMNALRTLLASLAKHATG